MVGYNFEKCMSCEYFYKNLYCCPFTACIKRKMMLIKDGKLIELNLDNLTTLDDLNKNMKEGKVYSSTGVPKKDGIFSLLPLSSPLQLQEGGFVSQETIKKLGLNIDRTHETEYPKEIKKIMKKREKLLIDEGL